MKNRFITIILTDRQENVDDSIYFCKTTLTEREVNKVSHKEQDENEAYTDESIMKALEKAGVEFIGSDAEYVLDFWDIISTWQTLKNMGLYR